ncbi:MAG: hypothetical protein H7296_07035 [Bacteroidia bacterium]|nr:hypothetical protein [Bacteroidia bacterium]
MTFKGPNPSVNVITYEVYRSSGFGSSVNSLDIKIGSTYYYVYYTFDGTSYYLPDEDSIFINNSYSRGGYADKLKTILYNKEYGILKFKLYNHVWRKIK